jgi:tetratricopeptide (TPR) repeat protein
MPHINTRGRWLGMIAVAALVSALVLWRALARASADPVGQGLAAYDRGDWDKAANLARQRLKAAAGDPAALRLLARVSVRAGRNQSAIALFGRLGGQAMLAEDHYLLGLALNREGNRKGAKEVWELARAADPNHTEALFELTRAYLASDQLLAATKTARLLAAHPGREAQGDVLLGAIELELNNPGAAIAHWQRALAHKTDERASEALTVVPQTDLVRALLQVRRSHEAHDLLRSILAAEPDREAFWLESRAFLQQGAIADALNAWEKSGSFRDENPLLPEPAQFVGSEACAECHRAVYQAQQSSRHARTFFRACELAKLDLPISPFADPGRASVNHVLQRIDGDRLQQETHVDGKVFRAVVDYAFGSGDRGLTLVGHDEKAQAHELRLSHYREASRSVWDGTSGHPAEPTDPSEYLGQPLTDDAVRRCFLCHVTNPHAVLQASGPGSSDRGIGCEKCHGPGGNHLLAVAAKFPDLSIARPTLASGARVVRLCAQCHSPRGQATSPDDPFSVRFQGTTLTWSRCFRESNDMLDCTTCHDPHRNVVTSKEHYESKCLSCHTAAPRVEKSKSARAQTSADEKPERTVCRVNPTSGCIECHMPTVKNVVPHSAFTDHFIRVHRD